MERAEQTTLTQTLEAPATQDQTSRLEHEQTLIEPTQPAATSTQTNDTVKEAMPTATETAPPTKLTERNSITILESANHTVFLQSQTDVSRNSTFMPAAESTRTSHALRYTENGLSTSHGSANVSINQQENVFKKPLPPP